MDVEHTYKTHDKRDYSPTMPNSDITWDDWEKHHKVLHWRYTQVRIKSLRNAFLAWLRRGFYGLISLDYLIRLIIFVR